MIHGLLSSVPLVETVPKTEAAAAAAAAAAAPTLHDDAIDMFALHDDASGVSCGCHAAVCVLLCCQC
jgi:hypothetical protein